MRIPPKVEQKFIACSHIPKRLINNSDDDQPNADAPDFTKGTVATGVASEIDSSVEIDRSSKDISERSSTDLERRLSVVSGSRASGCLKSFIATEFAAQKDLAKLTKHGLVVRRLAIARVGDQSAALVDRLDAAA